jgi:hypothetical protein
MEKSDLYFNIKSIIRVYVNFSEIEIQLNNKENLLVLDGCQTRFIYGLINYLYNYLQFRRNLLKNKFESSSSNHFYSIIFINSFNYDLIIRQWYTPKIICS